MGQEELEGLLSLERKFAKEGLTFDDVLIVPAESSVLPAQASTRTRLTRTISLEIPLVAAAMDTVTEARMAIALAREGGIGVIHRNLPVEEQAAEVAEVKRSEGDLLVAAAVGTGPEGFERAAALVAADVDALVVDTSHGHSQGVLEIVRELKSRFDVQLIAGNVATAEGTHALAEAGADAIKVGMGPGCFAAGTRVLMADATYKSIEDIRPGERVINMNGEPVAVLRAWCTGIRHVIESRHVASHRRTLVTPDHKYYRGDLSTTSAVSMRARGYVGTLERPTKRGANKIGWRSIGEVERGAMLLPRRIRFELPDELTIDLGEFALRRAKLARYRTEIRDSYELGYVFGTFLGDGTSFLNRVRNSEIGRVSWYFGPDEQPTAEKLSDCVENVSGVRPRIAGESRKTTVHLFSLQWARLFARFGKRHEKHLPPEYLVGNPIYLKGLFDGLVDSDGNVDSGGRLCFRNTSERLVELFGLLCFLLEGSFPNATTERPTAGGLRDADVNACLPSYRARLNVSHRKRHLRDFQVVKELDKREVAIELPVYDLEIDCPTHSFIADNAIVHNSICTTRVVAGIGMPQVTAVYDCAKAASSLGIPVISDGGIRSSGDLAKAIAAGADTVMVGGFLAGVDESPGAVVDYEGGRFKVYRGMGSIGAMKARYGSDRYFQGDVEDVRKLVPEGIEGRVPYKGALADVVYQLVGGLRQAMGYCGAGTIDELKRARFVRVTAAGVRESHPHGVAITEKAPNYNPER